MTTPDTDSPQWTLVDEGWGRKAVDFATLSEPSNCREYVTMHHRLGVDAGDRLLDVACGSGLAIELARLRGAACSGYRRLAQAGRGGPGPQPRIRHPGRRHARAALGPGVVRRRHQLPRHLGDDTGRGGRAIPRPPPGRPGRAHGLGSHQGLARRLGAGAVPARRDREGRQPGRHGGARPARCGRAAPRVVRVHRHRARSTCRSRGNRPTRRSTRGRWLPPGPAYEAIQNVGEAEFHRAAVELAEGRLRDGLPLRAEINVVGYLARKPEGAQRP